MNMIAKICDPVIVMAEGVTLVSGGFEQIAANPLVQDAYMSRPSVRD